MRTSSAHARSSVARHLAVALALVLGLMSVGVAFPSAAAHATPSEEKCTTYWFEYADGHVDEGEVCGPTPTTNLYEDADGIHVPQLHISCSDTFDTPRYDEDGTLLGYDSSGDSDLGGHLIAVDADGVGQWGIVRDWTGEAQDCGIPGPTEDEPQPCVGDVVVEVRHAETDALVSGDVTGTFDGDTFPFDTDGSTEAGEFDCDTDHTTTLTEAPEGYQVVDGTDTGTLVDSDDDGVAETLTLVLTVDEVVVECVGDVMIEVREASSGELVSGAAEGTYQGDPITIEGTHDAGSHDCDTTHTATLTEAPEGYEVVDGSDEGTITEDGQTVTLVLTVDEVVVECVGDVMIEVRDDETGEIVPGDASGTFDGEALALDADGTTDAGSFDCDTDHTATLTEAPEGYEVVDGSDEGTITEDGQTVTLVLTVAPVDETGVGGEEEVCEGSLQVIVIAPGGGEIDGPVTIDGTPVQTPHTTGDVLCDTLTVVLDTDQLPDGVELDSVTNSDTPGDDEGATQTVVIADGDEDEVVFVLGTTPPAEQPADDEVVQPAPDVVEVPAPAVPTTPTVDTPAPTVQDPAPDDTTEVLAEANELPRTGGEPLSLLLLAGLLMVAGLGTLRLGRPTA